MSFVFHLIASAFPIGLLAVFWQLQTKSWRNIATSYPSCPSQQVLSKRRMQSVILPGGIAKFRSYKGIVTVSVSNEGVSFELMPPWSIGVPRVFAPFADIEVRPSTWYINAECYRLALTNSETDLLIDSELLNWIQDVSHVRLKTSWDVSFADCNGEPDESTASSHSVLV